MWMMTFFPQVSLYLFVFPEGVVEFGPDVTGKDQNTKMLLNDQDLVRFAWHLTQHCTTNDY